MIAYVARRLLSTIVVMAVVALVVFSLLYLTPGDPATLKVGDAEQRTGNQQLTAQIIEETRALYGLDQPLYIQYFRWLKRMMTLDFGES